MSAAHRAASLRPLPAARAPSRRKAEPGALAAWGFSFHFKYFTVVGFFVPATHGMIYPWLEHSLVLVHSACWGGWV